VAFRDRSKCTFESVEAMIGLLRNTRLPEAQQHALELVQWVAGQSMGLNAMGKVQRANYSEGVSKAITSMVSRAKSKGAEGYDLQWTTEAGLAAAAKAGGQKGASEVVTTELLNQHAISGMFGELLGMVRGVVTKPRPTQRGYVPRGPEDALPRRQISELADRGLFGINKLRSDGIPFVTTRSLAKTADEFHASHLTIFDILKLIERTDGNAGLEVLARSMFRTSDAVQNIPSQNVAEAVRRIVQFADEGRAFTNNDELAALILDVNSALAKVAGKPVSENAKRAIAQNEKWMASEVGAVAVRELADTLTSPAMLANIIEENTKQRLIMAALAKGDGYRMAADVLEALYELPGNFDKAYGLGSLIMGKGLRDIYRNDYVSKLTPEQMNISFAEQGFAKMLTQLHPASLAEAAETYANVTGIRAAVEASKKAGKVDKSPRNRNVAEKLKNQAEDVSKLTDDLMKNDESVRAIASSEEEARIALNMFNEIQYGSIMGGTVKLISKVYDPANMTKAGKTILLGTENKFIENAVSMGMSLNKIRRSAGGDTARVNAIFRTLQDAPTSNFDEIAAAIAKLPEGDRAIAERMMSHIDDIFGNGQTNNMMANGIFKDEYAEALTSAGLRRYGDFFRTTGDEIDPTSFRDYWKALDLEDGEDALDIMGKFYSATQLSQIKPTLAASMINNFSHTTYGLTRKEALEQGFKAIDDSTDFGRYLQMGKEPPLFPPEMIGPLKAMNQHLDFERGFGASAKFWKNIDAVTSVMKSSITIWRPGHHMVNLVGGALMNTLEGVRPVDYVTAIKMLKQRGSIEGADNRFLARILAADTPPGSVIKGDPLNGSSIALVGKDGKVTYQSVDLRGLLTGADDIGGVPIAERMTRDVIGDAEGVTGLAKNAFLENPLIRGVRDVDSQLARVSAARDNLLRYALFNKVLTTGGPFKSLEEAFLIAARKVHEYHPTVGTLTAWERKYARRAFYFYTWQKQALFKIMEYAASAPRGPAILTIPSKFQYTIAEAQGLNPASFGDPYDPAKIFAAYNSETVYGPQWVDERWGAMGVKPALPQADILDAYLGKFQVKPEDGLWGNLGNLTSEALTGIVAENLPPIFKLPAELATRQRVGGIGGDIDNFPEYMIDQTGLGTPSRMLDMTPFGPRSDTKLDPFAEANRERLWWNWFLGMKVTFYESPASIRVGRQEQIDYWRKTLNMGQYAPKMSLSEFNRLQRMNDE